MDNMFFYTAKSRKRRRNRRHITLMLVIAALLVGFSGYILSRLILDTNDYEEEIVETDPDYETASWSSSDHNSNTNGIYMLWSDPDISSLLPISGNPGDEVWMSDFVDTRTKVNAKGIYIPSGYFNRKIDEALELVDNSELNAMVIDIKNDKGFITYMMDYDMAREIDACTDTIADIKATVKKLKEHGVYLIARVVSLKDPVLAGKMPELALKTKDGSLFRDSSGLPWVNPYDERVWDYLIEICRQCVEVGFDEVNLDYIRFSTDSGMADVDFGPRAEETTRMEIITNGIKRLCEVIKPMGAFVSCDVYGSVISSATDARIVGQNYFNMAKYLDYICPMVYPSHYGSGYYGLDYPDCHPYELVYHALMDSQKVLYMLDADENVAEVRPWLQDFTATWVKNHIEYGATEVRSEINAVYDSGYSQWFLWNTAASYTSGALLDKDETSEEQE